MTRLIPILSILIPLQFQLNSNHKKFCYGFFETTVAKTQQSCNKEEKACTILDDEIIGHQLLSNGKKIPLIGLSLGFNDLATTTDENKNNIENVISTALSKDNNLGYRLFCTMPGSSRDDERLISETISKTIQENNLINTTTTIHIMSTVSNVLGYDQTKLSMEESFNALTKPIIQSNALIDLQIHFLLSQYKINDKDTNDNPDIAKYIWNESWKALEDMYDEHQPIIASIGVSNFEKDDLEELLLHTQSRMKPHLVRGNILQLEKVWNVLQEHDIRGQVHQVFRALSKPKSWFTQQPREILQKLSGQLSTDKVIYPSSIIISYFTYIKNIGILSQTTHHLIDNSPLKARLVPELEPEQLKLLDEHVVQNLYDHIEAVSVKLVITNHFDSKIDISYVDQNNEKTLINSLNPGENRAFNTFQHHQFMVSNSKYGNELTDIHVIKKGGETEYIDLSLEFIKKNEPVKIVIHNTLPIELDCFSVDNDNEDDVFKGKLFSEISTHFNTNIGQEFYVRDNLSSKEVKRFFITAVEDTYSIYITQDDLNLSKTITKEVNLHNELDVDVDVYLVDHNNNKESIFQGSIERNTMSNLHGVIGHDFFIVNKNDEQHKIIQRFIVTEKDTVIYIKHDNVPPSIDTTSAVEIQVNNQYDFIMQVHWIDSNTNEEIFLATVQPKHNTNLSGFSGHEFVVRDVEGNEYKKFTADVDIEEKTQVVILSVE